MTRAPFPRRRQQNGGEDEESTTSDEYATAEGNSQENAAEGDDTRTEGDEAGGAEEDDQQHPLGQQSDKFHHPYRASEDVKEDDVFSTGLPQVEDWADDEYTPDQEDRLSKLLKR